MKAVIAMALAILPWSVSAQTAAQKQNLDEYIANLRTCAQAHASEARAAGIRTPDEAANYFVKVCISAIPVLGLFLSGPDADGQKKSTDELKDMGTVQPGMVRAVFREEWAVFIERMDRR